MSNVYLAIPGAPDRLLGHVHDDGKVYRSQAGLDDLVGRPLWRESGGRWA